MFRTARPIPPRGGVEVSDCLSIIVPVFNDERELKGRVTRLLDDASDFAEQFEVLIVDDGSTDQTFACAQELRRQFPQLRIIRHAQRGGLTGLVRDSLCQTRGRCIYVHDENQPLPAVVVRRHWTESQELPTTGKHLMWGSIARRVAAAAGNSAPQPQVSATALPDR